MGKYVVASQLCLPANWQISREQFFQCTFFAAQIYFFYPTHGAELPSALALVSFAGNPNWKGKYFNAWTYRQRVLSA